MTAPTIFEVTFSVVSSYLSTAAWLVRILSVALLGISLSPSISFLDFSHDKS